MKNDYTCGYGDCSEQGQLPIVLTDKTRDPQERPRFCTYAHAIGWLLGQAERHGGAKESALLAIQGIVRIKAEDLFGRTWERSHGDESARKQITETVTHG